MDRWHINACPMSTYTLAESSGGLLAGWETAGRVFRGTFDSADSVAVDKIEMSGANQKHPFVTAAANGNKLLVWTEGTGWQRGGTLVWQVVDKAGQVVSSGRKADAIPVWGLASAYAKPDGSFVIVY